MPRVLNKRTDKIPPDAIYVGRPSKWGNPFRITKDTSRLESIEMYKEWLGTMIFGGHLNPTELKGKDLVCWCSPLPCHADILLAIANKMG